MNRLLAVVNLGDTPIGGGKSLGNTYGSFNVLINIILRNSLIVIGLILLAILIYGGILFISSAGSDDSKKTALAKAIITDAIIGFVVVFFAFAIIQLIQTITGVSILNSTL